MSPVARNRTHAGRALAVAAVGVGLTIAVAFGVSVLANRGSVEVRLGDETFVGQDAASVAEEIAARGPILYPDAASGDRDIVLQHLGDDPNRGWLAFAARPPGAPRACTIRWEPDDQVFRLLDADGEESGACDGRELPPDGEGLAQYRVTVRDGELDVDLNADS